MNLRQRLTFTYVLVALVATLLTGVVGAVLLRMQQQSAAEHTVRLLAQEAAVRYRLDVQSSADTLQAVQHVAQGQDVRLLLVDPEGAVVFDSAETLTGESHARQLEWVRSVGTDTPLHTRPVQRLRVGTEALFVTPLPIPEQVRPTVTPLLAFPAAALPDTWSRFLPPLLALMVVTLVIAGGLAWHFAHGLSTPLTAMARAAKQIATGDYDVEVTIDARDDEIGELAHAFNTLVQDVETARQAQRDVLTNIGHDLRTPLTSIQGFSQALLDGTVDSEEERRYVAEIIHEEASRLTRLIRQVLDLARIEAGTFSMLEEEADLRDVLDHLESRYGTMAEREGISFDVRRPRKSLPIVGDADRLEQALTNLLDNAFEHAGYNGQDGHVRLIGKLGGVRGTNGTEGAGGVLGRWWIELVVADNGPDIGSEDLSHVFERVYQGGEMRIGGGAGLGLAIANEIVEAHGGEIEIESDGDGTMFQVRLPMNMGF